MSSATYMILLGFVLSLFTGCGGDAVQDSHIPTTSKEQRASFYITKGNFVDVASFAYKRATDTSFTTYAMDITLPGTETNERVNPSTYNITTTSVDNKIKKILVKNYQSTLELKIIDGDRVNILLKDNEYTIDEEMSLDDFLAQL